MNTKLMTNEELKSELENIKQLFVEKKAYFGTPNGDRLLAIENEMMTRNMLKPVFYNED